MRLRFSPNAFSAAFCVAYLAVFALNRPLFYYYPLMRQFSHSALTAAAAGPPIVWYGLMASAALAASVVAVLIDETWCARVLRGRLWLFPFGAMLGTAFLLRHFFL